MPRTGTCKQSAGVHKGMQVEQPLGYRPLFTLLCHMPCGRPAWGGRLQTTAFPYLVLNLCRSISVCLCVRSCL